MKTIRQALRQRVRRILAAVFAEASMLASGRRNAPQVRRRRIEAQPWPQVRRPRRRSAQ